MHWTTPSPGIERALQTRTDLSPLPQQPRQFAGLRSRRRKPRPLASFRRALGFDLSYAEAHCGLGGVRHEQGHFEEAQAHYREALGHQPDLPAAHCDPRHVSAEELGDFKDAERCWRAGAAVRPANGRRLFISWPRCCAASCPTTTWPPCASCWPTLTFTTDGVAALHFGLAQVLDARGRLQRGRGVAAPGQRAGPGRAAIDRGQGYDPAEHARFVAGMIAVCTPAFFERMRGLGLDSERPVFIVGLPRSGTTLTEQILASHSQVFGAGEQRLWRATTSMPLAARGSDRRTGRPRAGWTATTARRVGGQHLERLNEMERGTARVADKMPDNYLYLGLLAALFPRAKFVHCRRDLRDIAVSCWMTNFRQIRWANDPEHIASRFTEHRRMMAHWKRALPAPLLEIDYEETVANLEGVARQLVAWCGLEWEPGCLKFHEGKRPVRTASVSQVRQPVYQRSVARWKNYEQTLGGLFDQICHEKADR